MPMTFDGHLSQVTDLLSDNQPVAGLPSGQWKKNGWIHAKLQNLFNVDDTRIFSLGKAFCNALDDLEKSYRLAEDPEWFSLGEIIVLKLKIQDCLSARKVEFLVLQRLIGLKRRENFSAAKILTTLETYTFQEGAIRWKRSQKHFYITKWLDDDQERVDDVCERYPDFVRLLCRDPNLFSQFLDWTIRDHMSVSSFVEFPKTQELLRKIELAPSASIARKPKLKIKTKHGVKYLTFPLYANHHGTIRSKSVRLWEKDREYELAGGYRTTLREIYHELSRKNKHWVNYVITENGFENWNVREWGTLDSDGKSVRSALPRDRWFHNVPILERLSLEKAQNRYGQDLDGTNYGIALRATRRRQDLDVIGSHSFFELCIPDKKGGYFTICPGKLTLYLPQSVWDLVKIFGNTVEGVIVSHDSNVVYPWRQQTRYSVTVETNEFLWFAEKMRVSIENGRTGNLVFSLLADSCSVWSQNLMNELLKHLPDDHPQKLTAEEELNFFIMKIKETEPNGPLSYLIGIIKFFPEFLQPIVTYIILLAFYPFRGKWVYEEDGTPRWVSAYRSQSWNHLQIHNPANLFHQQINEGRFLPSGLLPEWLQ
ncbi:MAG: hypothetical protein K940chlam3_00042 [Chlamydiae bacterium]|nr:hypothetical protein [Chlamydiota bacterium]